MTFDHHIGPTQSELSPGDAFGEASEVRNIIESKSYFRGSCDLWHHVIDGILDRDLALCAIGGLTNHLLRLKVNMPYKYLVMCLENRDTNHVCLCL